MRELVILVDEHDVATGTLEKLRAHREARLHRAFSVFLFDRDGALLLQRRARGKYHSGGLWSNACCGHPRPGEGTAAAARRRLREEMGLDCELAPLFSFRYRAELPRGLCEHELDHVFVGVVERSATHPRPDPAEVEAWGWFEVEAVRTGVRRRPADYTVWFRLVLERVLLDGAPDRAGGAAWTARALLCGGPSDPNLVR